MKTSLLIITITLAMGCKNAPKQDVPEMRINAQINDEQQLRSLDRSLRVGYPVPTPH